MSHDIRDKRKRDEGRHREREQRKKNEWRKREYFASQPRILIMMMRDTFEKNTRKEGRRSLPHISTSKQPQDEPYRKGRVKTKTKRLDTNIQVKRRGEERNERWLTNIFPSVR